MLRAVPLTVKVQWCALAVAALLGLDGCYWYRYRELLEIHCQLLSSMSEKLCGPRAGAPLSGPALAEYEYPLARARDFARVAAKRCPGRRSLLAFGPVLRLYERMVQEAARGGMAGCGRRERLEARIGRVRGRLAREPGHCG